MKGYIMYRVGHVTFKKEYVSNINNLRESDIFIRLINFKTGVIKSEKDNVNMVFKGQTIAGNRDLK